jgi:hypothetical protein
MLENLNSPCTGVTSWTTLRASGVSRFDDADASALILATLRPDDDLPVLPKRSQPAGCTTRSPTSQCVGSVAPQAGRPRCGSQHDDTWRGLQRQSGRHRVRPATRSGSPVCTSSPTLIAVPFQKGPQRPELLLFQSSLLTDSAEEPYFNFAIDERFHDVRPLTTPQFYRER